MHKKELIPGQIKEQEREKQIKQQKKEEQIREHRSRERNHAIQNLTGPLADLAVSYSVNRNEQYGEAVDSALEEYFYAPARNTKPGRKLIYASLLEFFNSIESKKRYTGSDIKYRLIKDSVDEIRKSLLKITVNDVLSLMGSRKFLKQNPYLFELGESEDKESQELVKTLINSYLECVTNKKISEALSKRADSVEGNLEKIVIERLEPKS